MARVIKKYPNRRLYDTETSAYITLAEVKQFVLAMFSSDMLANVIRYYGHSMQGLMGSYLERSIGAFHEAQKKFQEQSSALYGAVPNFRPDAWAQLVPGAANIPMGDFLEKSASSVISMQEELRKQAMQMFSAFPYAAPSATAQPAADKPESEPVAPRAKTRRGK